MKSDSGIKIASGDMIILVFAKTGAKEPGIYGWGIINDFKNKQGKFSFRPVHPSDYLKMNPVWDDELSNLLDEIRGPVKVGTMWEISFDHAIKLKQNIHRWMK